MSRRRLSERVPSTQFVSIATLANHELRFHKSGMDGSAKCDAFETNRLENTVHGVIFEIAASEKYRLDRKEGLGYGYGEKNVTVLSPDDEPLHAITYYATHIDSSLKPFHWYKEHVLRGARENGLPEHYIEAIAGIESVADPEIGRHQAEMAIYL